MLGRDFVARCDSEGALPPPVAPLVVRRLCALFFAVTILGLALAGGLRILGRQPDFEYFYKSGAWLLAHGGLDRGYDLVGGRVEPRGALDWYVPFVPRFMTLLAWLPYVPAGYLWLTGNVLAVALTLRMLGRNVMGLPPQDWPVTLFVPFLLSIGFWTWEFRLNQTNALTLALVVGSFVCWQRGRGTAAGFWLGLAVLLKLTPALVLVWFALKRAWRTVIVAIATAALAGPLADVAALGPAGATSAYRDWLKNAVVLGSHRGLILGSRELDWRNQSLAAVLSRWLRPTNYNTYFDNDPRVQAALGTTQPLTINAFDLSRHAVADTTTVLLGLTLIALLALAHRPARLLTLWQLRFEWALVVLAMLWFMPVMRFYHMIWSFPALVVIAAGAHYSRRRGLRHICVCGCFVGTLLAVPALVDHRAAAAGLALVAVAVLAVPLVAVLLRLRRDVTVLPVPHYADPHPARCAGGFAGSPALARGAEPMHA